MVKVIHQQSAAVVMALSHWIALYFTPYLYHCKTVCIGSLFYFPTSFTLNMATVMYGERLEQLQCITIRNPPAIEFRHKPSFSFIYSLTLQGSEDYR